MREALQRAWLQRGLLAWLLWPVSLIYGLVVAVRRAAFRCGLLASHAMPVPVVVVGNVVAGGAGKTPVVIALVRHLQAAGRRPGVVSRGYGRRGRACHEVKPGDMPADAGDEPMLIARATGAPVFVAARRADAAGALLATHPAVDVLVCDDGLQHLALRRDIEICVFDQRGTGNGFLLPAGPLREPWRGHADLVLRDVQSTVPGYAVERALADHAVDAHGNQVALGDLAGRKIIAVAAIANPEGFFGMLRSRGLTLESTIALPDHFDYQQWQAPRDALLLCTEKDAAKLWQQRPAALAVPLLVSIDADFWRAFDARLSSLHGHQTA